MSIIFGQNCLSQCWLQLLIWTCVLQQPVLLQNAKYSFIKPPFQPQQTELQQTTTMTPAVQQRDIVIGSCVWVIDRTCPDKDIQFYLYTRQNAMDRQVLRIGNTLDNSNLRESHFNPQHDTKIILHGYNADMFMHPLIQMKDEYLAIGNYNLIYVDWSILAPGPCYISAVHNTRHVGACIAQLVERILDYGSSKIHVIGFSLGAQVGNFIAKNLGSFQLPRITGLDPALPLFVTASKDEKLDASDAAYVDVIHTNAMVQGKLERCGHADFYMNGGLLQPGCTGWNPSPCSHTRAPEYFMESIRSKKGFWGWSCSSYIAYLLGMCPATNYLVEAGEHIKHSTRGMFLVTTNDTAPYALGKWTDLPMLGAKKQFVRPTLPPVVSSKRDPLLKVLDTYGKLEYNFNMLPQNPTPFSQDPYGENWTYFNGQGTAEITNELKEQSNENNSVEEQQLEESNENIFYASQQGNQNNLEKQPQQQDRRRYNNRWQQYKRNLSDGFIETSIFTVPYISN